MTRVLVAEALRPGLPLALPPNAGHHLVTVLRLRVGERITVFDGSGGEAQAVVRDITRGQVTVVPEAPSFPVRESPLQIELGLCVSKAERMDLSLQKCVELGAYAFAPLSCERSVVRLDDARWARKQEHWLGVVRAACEQSGRVRVPAVAPLCALLEWLGREPGAAGIVCAPGGGERLRALPRPTGRLRVLVGPEGGLAPQELAAAQAAGFRCVGLGPRTLRTETAGIACMAAVQALWGDLS